jgi:hypothetical protein
VFRGMAVKAFSRTRPPGKRSHSSMRYDACRLVPGGINPFTEPGGGAASQIWPNPLHGSREMGLLCWGGGGGPAARTSDHPPLDIAAVRQNKSINPDLGLERLVRVMAICWPNLHLPPTPTVYIDHALPF